MPEPPLIDRPLKISVESDELVIRIGVGTLAFCFETSEENQPFDDAANDFRREWKVADRHKFASGVASGLQIEDEAGGTPLIYVIEKAFIDAVENNMGVEEDGRIVTDRMHRGLE